jgi:hypothetical protein
MRAVGTGTILPHSSDVLLSDVMEPGAKFRRVKRLHAGNVKLMAQATNDLGKNNLEFGSRIQ